MKLEEIPTVVPADFFELMFELNYLKSSHRQKLKKKIFRLPETESYLDENADSRFYMAWNEEGIFFQGEIFSDTIEASSPEFRRGDSLELFFDTRNIKSQGYITKFCHQFVIFPEKVDGYFMKEVTRFRNEDMHNLADPSFFDINIEVKEGTYLIDLFIPSKCLYGFDSSRLDRLGFTYRVNKKGRPPEHFSLSSEEVQIERNPFFWSTALLTRD
jgi:hypothetical protein